MKKILLVATMLLGALSAQAGVAISEATYGIINIPINPGMNAVGISLLPMVGEANAIENIVLPDGLTAAAASGDADGLYVFNGTDYAIYWLDNSGTAPTWNPDNASGSPEVAPGNAVWIKAKESGTVYQVGTVADDTSIDVPLAHGNNFIANPFPADFNLAAANWTGVAAAGKTTMATADLIRTWGPIGNNKIGYTTFYYVDVSSTYPASIPGWYNANTYQLATDIPAGDGFWFVRRGESSTPVTVSYPFGE